jgi:hypothetical protein
MTSSPGCGNREREYGATAALPRRISASPWTKAIPWTRDGSPPVGIARWNRPNRIRLPRRPTCPPAPRPASPERCSPRIPLATTTPAGSGTAGSARGSAPLGRTPSPDRTVPPGLGHPRGARHAGRRGGGPPRARPADRRLDRARTARRRGNGRRAERSGLEGLQLGQRPALRRRHGLDHRQRPGKPNSGHVLTH